MQHGRRRHDERSDRGALGGPPTNLGPRDLQEFLIHELGHTLLFLDEWRFGLFTSYPELLKRENWVASAIRKTVRPLDKAFHSVVVATEVLLARDHLLGHPATSVLHPSSPVLASGVLRSIESMTGDPTARLLLTDHALRLLDRCQRIVSDMAQRAAWPNPSGAADEVTAKVSG
jgi:hypothetical protein